MAGARVLLTGAMGSVGRHTLRHLIRLGHDVHAFDLPTPATVARQQTFDSRRFTMHWGDLRDLHRVSQIVASARPEVVLHVGAVIAPVAYVHDALAEAVNVQGTANLIECARKMPAPVRFVFTSSYSVHGPRNPHRALDPITGETPVAPGDNYGRHKVRGEQMVRASGLPWMILRLPAVLPTDPSWGRSPPFLKFFFLLDPDRREHLLDARDAALGLAHAVEADGVGQAFALGGPPDCRVLGREFHVRLMEARGLRPLPSSAFRRAHPEVDEAWYFEDFVDTTKSQAVLRYQQHTFADYLAFVRQRAGFKRYGMKFLAPLVSRYMAKYSPYVGRAQELDRTPMADVICDVFGLARGSGANP